MVVWVGSVTMWQWLHQSSKIIRGYDLKKSEAELILGKIEGVGVKSEHLLLCGDGTEPGLRVWLEAEVWQIWGRGLTREIFHVLGDAEVIALCLRVWKLMVAHHRGLMVPEAGDVLRLRDLCDEVLLVPGPGPRPLLAPPGTLSGVVMRLIQAPMPTRLLLTNLK